MEMMQDQGGQGNRNNDLTLGSIPEMRTKVLVIYWISKQNMPIKGKKKS